MDRVNIKIKWLLGLIFIIAGSGCSSFEFDEAEYVELKSMLSTIKRNEAKANDLYKDKLVLLGGRVHGKVEKDRFHIVPKGSDGQQISGAECRVNSNQKQALVDLVPRTTIGYGYVPGGEGSWVEIQGIVKGWSSLFVVIAEIEDCEILYHEGKYKTIIPFEHPSCPRGVQCTPINVATRSQKNEYTAAAGGVPVTLPAEVPAPAGGVVVAAPANSSVIPDTDEIKSALNIFVPENKLRIINKMKQDNELVDAAIWTCNDDEYPYVEEMDCIEIHIVMIVNDETDMERARELGQQFVATVQQFVATVNEFQIELAYVVFVHSAGESLTVGAQCQSCTNIIWID